MSFPITPFEVNGEKTPMYWFLDKVIHQRIARLGGLAMGRTQYFPSWAICDPFTLAHTGISSTCFFLVWPDRETGGYTVQTNPSDVRWYDVLGQILQKYPYICRVLTSQYGYSNLNHLWLTTWHPSARLPVAPEVCVDVCHVEGRWMTQWCPVQSPWGGRKALGGLGDHVGCRACVGCMESMAGACGMYGMALVIVCYALRKLLYCTYLQNI